MREQRNMASSEPLIMKMPTANWSNWTIRKATKDGYRESGWVYKSVSLIARTAAIVPWGIYNEKNELVDHPLTKILKRPNPQMSRQDLFELIVSWLELSGEGYMKKVYGVGKKTKELWPISPDRIAPIQSKETDLLIDDYEILAENGSKIKSKDYTTENIIQLKFTDPSNPIRGISPLMAAAKAVDIDNDQKTWNKSAMQNRGVLDGVFVFDRDLDQSTFDLLKTMIKERFGFGAKRAREPGIIGSAAKYQQMSLTPIEMDFLESRKFNREEIFIIFGIPLPLAGIGENMTYSNYSESLKIFWKSTIIPLLDDIADALNCSFADELGENLTISYDISNVDALRDDEEKKSRIAKTYFDIGVPVSELNVLLDLGINQYKGWDKSVIRQQQQANLDGGGQTRKKSEMQRDAFKLEKRNVDAEIKAKEEIGNGYAKYVFESLLTEQKKDIFKALDTDGDIQTAILKSHEIWIDEMEKLYVKIGSMFYKTISIENRAIETNDEIIKQITDALESQGIILIEKSAIDDFTTSTILGIIKDSQIEGKTVEQVKQAILDTGIFSSDRALRIARTETATSSSIGQMTSAINLGATHKIWHTAGFEVRSAHQHRSGEKRGIGEPFSAQVGNIGPMYPGDYRVDVADRINCRCSMSFSIED